MIRPFKTSTESSSPLLKEDISNLISCYSQTIRTENLMFW